jgi:GH15 family glucan-1,4-alpha-glucosidase
MSQIISTRNAIWRRSSFRLVTGSVTAIVLALNLGVQNAFPQSPPSVVSANLTAAKPAGLARNLTTTNPTATSAASIYASNWQNKIAIWNASKLNQNDTGAYGPRIAELRSSSAWSTNQIVDYSGFFQDTTDSVKYDQIHNFDSSAYLDENGALNSTYGKYSATTLPITIKRDYVMVPNQSFLVARYTLANPSASAVNWKVLDQVHLNNTVPANNVSASYDATRNAFFGDMTASGQSVVTLGAFQSPTSYQAGNDADCVAAHATASAWCQYDTNGVLSNNATLATPNVDLGFQNSVTIPANGSQTLYYYLGLGTTLATAQSAADTARAQTGAYWFTTTAGNYATWLAGGTSISTTDTGVNTAYLRNLVIIKNSQNPTNGLFPAATNPGSYGYKAWVRDSSFNAMALDAAGHYVEAAQYWNWMAANMLAGGTWHTTYDLWTGNYVSFVEPEYDSIGQFLTGVYKHYVDTGSSSFLTGVWTQVQAAANYVQSNIGTNGFGPADASIWEESVQFNVFTQAFYVAGLRAAALLAQVQSSPANADNWNGSATTILSAVQRSYSWSPAGMYNDTTGYYNRGVSTTGAVNPLIDSSSLALIVLGDIEANSSRATSMVAAIETSLTHDGVGLARYTGDPYYYSSPYNPAGNESGSAEPTWPNVTMFDAMYEVFTGRSADALAKLQWYVSRSGVGDMPPGEAVSWKTGQPIISTMSEPLTASSFIMAALSYNGSYDPRITAANTNLGAAATINVTTNAHADWPQWKEIPYATTAKANSLSGSAMTDIRRVYVTNDATNLYVRVDNSSGAFSGFNTAPKFGLLVYAQDFNHSGLLTSRSIGQYGRTLDHPMNYLAGRWSDGTNFSTFAAGTSAWNFTSNLGTIAPQWDTTTGRIEAVIPLSSFASSGSAAMGSWSNLDVELAYQNPGTGVWVDDDLGAINYRLTGSGTAWLYGNTLGKEISTLTTDKARYAPSSAVTITGRLVNTQAAVQSGATLTLHYTHLGTTVGTDQTASVNLAAGQAADFAVSWSPPATDYQGYLVQGTLRDSTGSVLDTAQTAVDVSSNWTKFPRYGFVTDFSDNYNQAMITKTLNSYHVDGVQFYDWEYKHHVPLSGTVASPSSSWVNIDNITNFAHSVTSLITDVHATGGSAMNYNLIYGAWAGYGTDGSGADYHQGLWWNNNCTNQGNFSLPASFATPNIYFFNTGDTSWQSYLFSKESDAFTAYAFDGWHMDQLGTLVGNPTYTCAGALVDPPSTFSGFITAAKAALNKTIVFNAPGQYSQQNVAANANLAFLYTECWPPNGQVSYNDLRNVVTQNNTWSGNTKNTVIAAYPDQNYSTGFTDAAPGFLNTAGVLYDDASIFAAGGSHLELGDVNHMLDQPNYLNRNLLMPATLQKGIANNYNFLTAYENLLRDGLTDNANVISLPGGPLTSTTGAAGHIWTFARSKTGTDVLQMINMLNLTSTDWMDTNANQPAPTTQTNLLTKYYYGTGTPTKVSVASPDINGGAAQSLSFTTGSDGGGNYVQFTVPSLSYWDMVWVNK